MAASHARRKTTLAAAGCYLAALPLLLLVLVGNLRGNNAVLADVYLFRLDVSQIIPIAVANSGLLNSVARSLGLHDFYQIGLWNFCEGFVDEGITFCSAPVQFYWFNPVEILVGELLAGAKIALPAAVITILNLLRIGSQVMYVCFTAGTVANFVLLFATPLVIRTRWFSPLVGLIAFASAAVLTVAAIIATVISLAAKIALTAQDQLNIRAHLGAKMFAFIWIAALLTDLAFLLHAVMGCCCRPQPRPHPSPAASASDEKTGYLLPDFVRRKRSAAV